VRWGLRRWSQVSGVGFDPSQGQVAAGTVGRRRGTGLPAAALGGGGAVRFGFSPSSRGGGYLADCSRTECQRQGVGGKRTAAAQHFWWAAARVTPNWMAGGPLPGSPPWLPGRPDGGGQGCRQRGGLQGHWSPAAAGGDQGHPKLDGRRATARVTLSFHGLPPVPPPSGQWLEASATRWATLASPGGSVVSAAK